MFSLEPLRNAPRTSPLRTRFAPSVTGHLHLGHAVNALFVWGIGRALGAEVIVRLEDHDRGRFRPEFERSILDDLAWLGLENDLPSPSRQSDHPRRYAEGASRLGAEGLTFVCDCSRRTIAAAQGADQGDALRYPGTCRTRALAEGPGRALRFRVDPGDERFTDLRLGPLTQDPAAEVGDLVLRDGAGQWTYQHCVVVDDLEEAITLVIRGEDLLASTGRQLRLFRALGGGEPPRYLHHPLVTGEDGRKLSKKEFARSLGDLRREGWTPERVLGEAAFLAGVHPERTPLGSTEISSLFI